MICSKSHRRTVLVGALIALMPALIGWGKPRALKLVESKDARKRVKGLQIMGKQWSDSAQRKERAVRWHRKLLDDPVQEVRVEALELFRERCIEKSYCEQHQIKPPTSRICDLLLHTDSHAVTDSCIRALHKQSRDGQNRAAILKSLGAGWRHSPVGRLRVVDFLRRLRGPGPEKILREMLDSENAPLRRRAIDALGTVGAADAESIGALVRLSAAPPTRVQRATRLKAGRVLGTLLPKASSDTLLAVAGTSGARANQVRTQAFRLVSQQAGRVGPQLRRKAVEFSAEVAAGGGDEALKKAARKALEAHALDLIEATGRAAVEVATTARDEWKGFQEGSRVAVVSLICTSAGNHRVVLSARLENAVEDAISEETDLQLVNRNRLRTLFEELRLHGTAVLDQRKMRELGRMAKADAIITGRFQTVGNIDSYWEVHLRIMKTRGEQTSEQDTATRKGWCRAGKGDLERCRFVPPQGADVADRR